MGVVKIRSRKYQQRNVTDFSGGVVTWPAHDSEQQVFTNFEIWRDGYPRSRLGTYALATTPMNAYDIQGIGITMANVTSLTSSQSATVVVAKDGSLWYAIPTINGTVSPQAPVAITVPSPISGARAKMTDVVDANGVGYCVATSSGLPGLIKWGGNSGAFAAVTGSPGNCALICNYGSCLYLAGQGSAPYTLYFSNPGDPFTWPTTNSLNVPQVYGPITGIESNPDLLLIFTARAILGLQGNPNAGLGNFRVVILHEGIGAEYPTTVSTYGNRTAFMFNNLFYVFAGGEVVLMSKRIPGQVTNAPYTVQPMYSFASMSATRYAYMPSITTPAQDSIIQYFDRADYQNWITWDYPASTKLGSPRRTQTSILWIDEYNLAIAGGDGQVYIQPLRDSPNAVQTADAPNVPVVSTLTSRVYTFGDTTMEKQFRSILVGGKSGPGSVSVVVTLNDVQELSTNQTVASMATLPLESQAPVVNGKTGASSFSSMSVTISGASLLLRGYNITYRMLRYDCGAVMS